MRRTESEVSARTSSPKPWLARRLSNSIRCWGSSSVTTCPAWRYSRNSVFSAGGCYQRLRRLIILSATSSSLDGAYETPEQRVAEKVVSVRKAEPKDAEPAAE